MQAGISIRAIAYEKSGRWFTTEEPFLRAKERTDAGSSAFRHPRSELIAPLPQEVEPAFNNRKLYMRLPWYFHSVPSVSDRWAGRATGIGWAKCAGRRGGRDNFSHSGASSIRAAAA